VALSVLINPVAISALAIEDPRSCNTSTMLPNTAAFSAPNSFCWIDRNCSALGAWASIREGISTNGADQITMRIVPSRPCLKVLMICNYSPPFAKVVGL